MAKSTITARSGKEGKNVSTSDTPDGNKSLKKGVNVTSQMQLRMLQQILHDYDNYLTNVADVPNKEGVTKRSLIIVLPGVHIDEHGNIVQVHGNEAKSQE